MDYNQPFFIIGPNGEMVPNPLRQWPGSTAHGPAAPPALNTVPMQPYSAPIPIAAPQAANPSPSDADMWGNIMMGSVPAEVKAKGIVDKMEAERAAKLAEFTKEFEAKQAAERAEFLRTLDWNIEHGVAPHQVKGRSPEDVERARGAAREIDEYVAGIDPNKPEVGGIGFKSRPALPMPEALQREIDEKRRLADEDRRSFDATITSGPGLAVDSDALAMAVEKEKIDAGVGSRTREGYLAGRDRAFREAIKEYVAAHKAADEALQQGGEAKYPGPLRTSRVSIPTNLPSGVQRTEEGKAFRAQKAAELAERKERVHQKAAARSEGVTPSQYEQIGLAIEAMQNQNSFAKAQELAFNDAMTRVRAGNPTVADFVIIGGSQAAGAHPDSILANVAGLMAQAGPEAMASLPAIAAGLKSGNWGAMSTKPQDKILPSKNELKNMPPEYQEKLIKGKAAELASLKAKAEAENTIEAWDAYNKLRRALEAWDITKDYEKKSFGDKWGEAATTPGVF